MHRVPLLRRFRTRPRLVVAVALLLALSLSVCGAAIFHVTKASLQEDIEQELGNTATTIVNMVEAAVDVSVRNYLRAVAEKNLEVVENLYGQYRAGLLTEEQARQRAVDILMAQTVGETGYIYCLHSDGVAAEHPKPGVRGKKYTDHAFIHEQMAQKEGYLEYDWANPGETEKRPKALYMTYFEPWDWIISASSYREEFYSLVRIEDFKQKVEAIRLGQTGYLFIVDGHGDIIVHPWVSGHVRDFEDISGYQFIQDIFEAKQGVIHYDFLGAGETRVREKVAVFARLPELEWIVAASMYADEVYDPINRIVTIVVAVTALSILLAVPLVLVIGRSVTAPVGSLVRLFDQAAGGDLETRSDDRAPDEIGQLAAHFNAFMATLERATGDLRSEVEARRLFEEVFNNVFEGILITDARGNIVTVNPAFTTITGYTPQEVAGRTPRVLKSDRHSPEFYAEMWDCLTRKGFWAGEIWNRRKSGQVYPEMLSIAAIRDGEGRTTHYAAVFNDITEHKKHEAARNELVEELEQSNAEMERFIYMVSHDLRSPLITILGFMGVLTKDLEEGREEDARHACARVESAATHMHDLLDDLLLFSRVGRLKSKAEDVSLDELVADVLDLLHGPLREADMEVQVGELGTARCERKRVMEVFQNLVENAVKYRRQDGQPRIEIGRREEDGAPAYYVADNGRGVDPRYAELIFGLFEQLDQKAEGSGVGLALVKRIVEHHGGRVWVESDGPGTGATFLFTLSASGPGA